MEDNFIYLFDKVGVFEKKNSDGDLEFRFVVDKVYRLKDDEFGEYLYIAYGDDESPAEYEVNLDEVDVDDKGNVHFKKYDGEYIIRSFVPSDGNWASKFKTDVPVKALEYTQASQEGDEVKMAQEFIAAYSKEVSTGPVFGVEYSNSDLGSFMRVNGVWVSLSQDDESFIDLWATFIDPEKADDFLKAYDKGGMTVEEADTYADEDAMPKAE